MGVEPTKAACAAPYNGFEDRGAHRDSSTPMVIDKDRRIAPLRQLAAPASVSLPQAHAFVCSSQAAPSLDNPPR